MSIAMMRRLDRLENPNGKAGPCEGLAQRVAKARLKAEERRAAGLPACEGETKLERYHRIKFSEDPAERAEAERLGRLFWPHLNR